MVITTTAVGFIVLSLGLALCGWMFFKAFRKTAGDSRVGFLLSAIFLGFSLQNGIVGLGMLFFANNPEILFYTLILSHFLLVLLGILGIYTSYYIFSPKISPLFLIIVEIILGILAIIILVVDHPQPFLTIKRGIDLDSNFLTSFTIFYLLFVSIGSTVYIFTKLLFQSKSRQIRLLSLVLSLLGILGILNIFIRFVVLYSGTVEWRTRIFDIGLGIIGAIFIIALFIGPKIKDWIRSRKTSIFSEEKI